jgi:hypothetical protein
LRTKTKEGPTGPFLFLVLRVSELARGLVIPERLLSKSVRGPPASRVENRRRESSTNDGIAVRADGVRVEYYAPDKRYAESMQRTTELLRRAIAEPNHVHRVAQIIPANRQIVSDAYAWVVKLHR